MQLFAHFFVLFVVCKGFVMYNVLLVMKFFREQFVDRGIGGWERRK